MKEEREFEVLHRIDTILDFHKPLKIAAGKILEVLMRETDAEKGAIAFQMPYEEELTVLASKGDIHKGALKQSSLSDQPGIRDGKLSYPIAIRSDFLGMIYLEGKNLKQIDLRSIKAAELVLDGRFDHEKSSLDMEGVFSKYVDEKIIKKILSHPDKRHLTGEKHNCSILFADINGFTEFSKKVPAEEVIKLLNDFYSKMAAIALKHNGTVDKFIGDEIMTVFGSPIPLDDHASRAIRTAIEMREEMKSITKKHNITKGGISAGIATGLIIAGDVGYEKMMDYTVVGTKVNLAARLTSAANDNEILVDEETKKHVTGFKYEQISDSRLQDFEGIKFYRVID